MLFVLLVAASAGASAGFAQDEKSLFEPAHFKSGKSSIPYRLLKPETIEGAEVSPRPLPARLRRERDR
ncbi:MAG TPA: hypothetical protein VHR72_05900 [Gemmataceae bacterium]|nr:hypothetical protein [Gemmataceae bacterium]